MFHFVHEIKIIDGLILIIPHVGDAGQEFPVRVLDEDIMQIYALIGSTSKVPVLCTDWRATTCTYSGDIHKSKNLNDGKNVDDSVL